MGNMRKVLKNKLSEGHETDPNLFNSDYNEINVGLNFYITLKTNTN